MVKIDADPLDGPTLDTSDPTGSVVRIATYLVGVGFLFAALNAAQNTTQPIFQSVMNMIPGVNAGGGDVNIPVDGSGL